MSLFTSQEWMQFFGALLISLISGVISIATRITQGHPYTLLWVFSEFLMAMLCGYLAYESYDHIPKLNQALTEPVFIAICAHSGGRFFQQAEAALCERYSWFNRREP